MKIGKTTFGSKMPGHLIIAAERGYNALPGAMVQDVTSWGELKQVVRELKKPEVMAVYKSLIIDTVDVLADACQKYICNQLGVENIGDGGWQTNGWAKYKKEFEDTFRALSQLGYAIVFISHDKEKKLDPKDKNSYSVITSSLQSSALSIIENMCDIIAYAHEKADHTGEMKRVLTLRSNGGEIRCGCRFSMIDPEIPFTYESLRKALNDAIDREAAATNGQYVTNERLTQVMTPEYDYDALKNEFNEIVNTLMSGPDAMSIGPKITVIVDKYLGKGKKVMDSTPNQAELIYLIVSDIKDELMNK